MKWLDPLPTVCFACGGQFAIPIADLRSLRATCPGCGASLAEAAEWMLTEEARRAREIDLLLVAMDLKEHAGVVLTDGEVETSRSLEDLVRAVAGRLRWKARATELVTEAARRAAPRLLAEANSED